MKLSRLGFMFTLIAAIGACSSDDAASESGCSITELDSKIELQCGDKTASLSTASPLIGADGEEAQPCTVYQLSDSIVISCGDNMVTLRDDALQAQGGRPGSDSSGICSITEGADNIIITCGDSKVILPMNEGDGSACTIAEASPGYMVITCPDNTSVGVSTCEDSPSYCDGDKLNKCGAVGWQVTICEYRCGKNDGDDRCVWGAGGFGGAGGMGGASID